MRPTSEAVKKRVRKLRSEGRSIRFIARVVHLAVSTVQKILDEGNNPAGTCLRK